MAHPLLQGDGRCVPRPWGKGRLEGKTMRKTTWRWAVTSLCALAAACGSKVGPAQPGQESFLSQGPGGGVAHGGTADARSGAMGAPSTSQNAGTAPTTATGGG